MGRLTTCEFFISLCIFIVFHAKERSRVTLLLNILFCGLVFVPKSPVSACAMAFPFYVLLNNMSSHVYRNVRLGFYQDQTIGTSVINRDISQSRHWHNPEFINPTSTKSEDRGDPEAGDIMMLRTSLAQGTRGEIKQKMEVED